MKLILRICIAIATAMTTNIALSTIYFSSASLFQQLNNPSFKAYANGFIIGAQDHMSGRGNVCVPDHISIGQLIFNIEQGYIKYPNAKFDTVLPANLFIETLLIEKYPCQVDNKNR